MKKFLSMVTAVAIMLMNVSIFAEGTYTVSDWARDEVSNAEKINIIPDELLSADLREDITREEFAGVSVKLYEYLLGAKTEEYSENPFDDTDNKAVIAAYNLGLTNGTSNTTFSPKDLLSREQAATMLLRVYKKLKYEDWSISADDKFMPEYNKGADFADDADISSWAKDAVYFMAANNVIKGIGDNKFAPRNVTEEQKKIAYANTTRQQAIIIAKRLTSLDISKASDKDDKDPKPAEEEKEEYVVGFIGGSLTEGGAKWIKATKEVIEKNAPEKTVKTLNAGNGGTTSALGTTRFMNDIGAFAPDMVFIEFAVNDYYYDDIQAKVYMENMVRQCLQLEKVPAVVFLYAPRPYEPDSAETAKWRAEVAAKEEIAKHYGIKSINIYDYMLEDYNKTGTEKGYGSFTSYLSTMYNQSGTIFDVHGGYNKYAEAITEAFDKDFEGFMNSVPENKDIYCATEAKTADAAYNRIAADDERLTFGGYWMLYTSETPYQTDNTNAAIPSKMYKYPFFPDGVRQTIEANAAVEFKTTANAIGLECIMANNGNDAKVYIDGKNAATVSCNGQFTGINGISDFIELPGGGEHTVKIETNTASDGKNIFRFGAIIEKFYEK